MKQRFFALFILCSLLLTACGQTHAASSAVVTSPAASSSIPSDEVIPPIASSSVLDSAVIYLPNEDAEALVATVVSVETETEADMTAEISALVQKLVEAKALPVGSEVLSVAQEDVLTLDMNAAFGNGLMSTGSTGETLYLGALVNTVLEYTGAERVLITVEGAPLETGHNIYDEPLGVIIP